MKEPVIRISSELAPINTLNVPLCFFQPCLVVSHMDKSLSRRANSTVTLSPGFSNRVFWNPLSCFGGSPAVDGKPRYNCVISAPEYRSPLFITSTTTLLEDARRLSYLKVVKLRPCPKGNRASFCAHCTNGNRPPASRYTY